MKPVKTKNTATDHFIVAIGASAGGLEPIHEFFDNISGNTGLSFVIIQHLSPDYKSLLVELVGKHTQMQVFEAEDGAVIEKDCVYVIPNNKLMTIADGQLKLSEKSAVKGPNTAIDFFLYTLAKEKGRQAIAIILSGTGTDGTKGIQQIKKAGGMVIVQDPITAKFDGMPNSAIATDQVDFILPPELMPAEIYEYVKISPTEAGAVEEHREELLNDIYALIHHQTGCDFHLYKTPTILRRINRRMIAGGFKSLDAYVHHLHENSEECKHLSQDFLIGVTKFFRDKSAFDVLYNQVFPDLVKSKDSNDFIKIWVTACSTGEEAYSTAILLDSYLSSINKIINVKIFATDIDKNAIDIASKGIYDEGCIKDIDPQILDKYFLREGNKYLVIPHIRKQIVFARHNILKDPPFIKNDMISCRNMLIYMESSLQRKLLSSFHFSLNNGGYLFLGSSETASNVKDKMEEINGRWKIYKKTEDETLQGSTRSGIHVKTELNSTTNKLVEKPVIKKLAPKSLSDDFKDVLAEDYGFAGVYIDRNYEIKEAVGNFRNFLSLPDKLANLNVLKMVPPDVSVILSTGLRKALKDGEKVKLNNIKLSNGDSKKYVHLLIKPPSVASAYILIVFSESNDKHHAELLEDMSSTAEFQSNGLLGELEAELKETKLNLQTAIEELETTNEELQSSNEELLSSNEELQSSNEELQSLNEELHTLNTEHQLKIKELIELNNDLDNYFRTTDMGQIFLDERLRIRKFNQAAVKMINLIETDIGRPIDHISTNILHQNLLSDIQNVVRTKTMIEKEVQLSNGMNCLLRMAPYLLQDKKPQGIVITFVDISALKDLNNIIKGVFNSSLSAIMAFKTVRNVSQQIIDFKWLAANYASDKFIDNASVGLEGRLLSKEMPTLVKDGFFERFIKVVDSGAPLHAEYSFYKHDQERFYELIAVKMMDGLVVTFTDITEKKEAEERLRRNFNELNKAKEKLKKLNEELEAKVAERTKELSDSEERFRLVANATNDAIWDWNLMDNKVWWSESFYSMLAYETSADTSNRNFWVNKIHPDDRERVRSSIYDAINHNGSNWTAEYRILKSDGSYCDVFDRGSVVKDEYGTPHRMVGSMMDVTDLRKAEKEAAANFEQWRFLAESIPLIVWTARPSGKLEFLNQHFSQYTGYEIAEGLKAGWQKVIHQKDLDGLRLAFEQAIKNKQDFSIELRIERKDKLYRWHLLRARAKRDASNNLITWVGTLTDIHEQKLANKILEKRVNDRTRELQTAIKELEISNNNLQQFAYIASHDLKEPLRKIQMFSLLVKDRYLKDANKTAVDYIERIISSSARLTKLVNDLLTFSTVANENLFEETDLNDLLKEILNDIELAITEKHAVINCTHLPTMEVIPAQMRQVFQNIITNAIKFSRKDTEPVIEIKCSLVAEKEFDAPAVPHGQYCRLEIQDNGIGFEQKYAGKIFMIFQRLHSKEQHEGTGIGLAITKKIIDKHNGIITAVSEEGKGAKFIMVLPVRQAQQILQPNNMPVTETLHN